MLVIVGWLFVWSNHFESSFHADDFPAIVSNSSLGHLSNIPRFFAHPRISSVDKDSATYRPLLTAWFAIDAKLFGMKPFTFQAENFVWFTAVLIVMFGFFRLIPGVNALAAGFATLLFGLHPATADTVNYALQRGVLMGAFGVLCGMLIFVYWPWRLPQTFPIKLKRVPENGFDDYLRKNYQRLEARYMKLIHLPVQVFLWPVIPALLCDASTAVFAPILIAYILLFEEHRTWRHAIPAAVVCAGYWIFQLVFTWNLRAFSLIPPANYWFSQPWVALRYLFKFFVPIHLSVETDFTGVAHIWDPLALAGYAGLAALVYLAVVLGRTSRWRPVAFGLWWFLIAQVPDAVVPHRAVEADWRMFLPFAGLALAMAGALSVLMEVMLPVVEQEPVDESAAAPVANGRGMPVLIAGGTVALGLLALLGWATYQRNAVWATESSLWRDTMQASPGNGRAYMHFGLTPLDSRDALGPLGYMKRAAMTTPGDAVITINLALMESRLSRTADAERDFKIAVGEAGAYSPAWSNYGQWLLQQSRLPEAQERATKAIELDPYDMLGRRTVMDIMGQRHEWSKLKEFSEATLRLMPEDPDGERSLLVAQTGLDNLNRAVKVAAAQPTPDHFLALSVLLYQTGKYVECISAAREALKIDPNLGEAWANIASAYHTMGKLDETIAALQEEVRLNPNLPSAKSNLEIELNVKGLQAKNAR
jgi:protein O-mannosyl-transferase